MTAAARLARDWTCEFADRTSSRSAQAFEQRSVIARRALVAPPIDLHVHVYGMGIFSIDPQAVFAGVTTMPDTVLAGALTYPTFHRFVISQSREDVFALLNISMIGCIQGHPDIPPYMGDLNDARHAHAPSAIECIQRYRDRIIGTKVRLTAGLANNCEENERAGLKGALEAAARTGLPCMVHHVKSSIPTGEMLNSMRSGDIVTHLYHPHADRAFSVKNGAPLDALLRARERGVIFDVGHGVGAFAWSTAAPACQQHGFWPDTISTDIHRFNINGPVFDMATTMSKFHLGMPLEVLQAHRRARARDATGNRFGDAAERKPTSCGSRLESSC